MKKPKAKRPTEPEEAHASRRQELVRMLEVGGYSFEDLRRELGGTARSVEDDLRHVALTLKHKGKALTVDPATCTDCGFVFKDRERYATPSRCPSCKSQRIEDPRFGLSDV